MVYSFVLRLKETFLPFPTEPVESVPLMGVEEAVGSRRALATVLAESVPLMSIDAVAGARRALPTELIDSVPLMTRALPTELVESVPLMGSEAIVERLFALRYGCSCFRSTRTRATLSYFSNFSNGVSFL